MKNKLAGALSIFTSLFMLTSCGGKTTPTKEFNYLPQVNDMKVEEHKEATKDEMGTATYTIKDTTSEKAMDDYFKKLKKDGWEITEDQRPTLIKAKKEAHEVTIIPTQDGENVTLTVLSK